MRELTLQRVKRLGNALNLIGVALTGTSLVLAQGVCVQLPRFVICDAANSATPADCCGEWIGCQVALRQLSERDSSRPVVCVGADATSCAVGETAICKRF